MELSILISYSGDRIEQLHRSLHSMYHQQDDFDGVELLLLNDGARKEVLLPLLERYTDKFRIRYFEVPGISKGYANSAARRNFLARQARGTYLLITDPEIVHVSATIRQVLQAFPRHGDGIWYCGPVYATSSVVTKTGRLAYWDRKREKNLSGLWGPAPVTGRPLDTAWYVNHQSYRPVNDPHFTEFFWCTAVAKSLYASVEGCNESLMVYGYEDVELFSRMRKLGVRRIYDDAFVTCHLPHTISLSPAEQRYWWIYNQHVRRLPQPDWGTFHGARIREVVL